MNSGQKVLINLKENIFLCKSEVLQEGKSIRIQVGEAFEEQVALFRVNGKIYCLTNICPHRHKDSIYQGFVYDGKVTCPEHGWTYDLESGKNINPRQGIRSLKSFNVLEIDGLIVANTLEFELPKWKDYQKKTNVVTKSQGKS
ncbi:MAG: Rieske (2Fe-2S) protein [Candidatus Kapaibacteriales bacterium]